MLPVDNPQSLLGEGYLQISIELELDISVAAEEAIQQWCDDAIEKNKI